MALMHMSLGRVVHGGKGSAKSAFDYIERRKKYKYKEGFLYGESGNLPAWCDGNAREYWYQADRNERANGVVCRKIEFALPNEITDIELQKKLVRDVIEKACYGDRLAWSYAIHTTPTDNIHAHVMISERIQDNVERTAEKFFCRANKKNPKKGGCVKTRFLKDKGFPIYLRNEIADLTNALYKAQGIDAHIDPRSYADQGIDKTPTVHMGPDLKEIEERGAESYVLKDRRAKAKARAAKVREAREAIDAKIDVKAEKIAAAELERAKAAYREAERKAAEEARRQAERREQERKAEEQRKAAEEQRKAEAARIAAKREAERRRIAAIDAKYPNAITTTEVRTWEKENDYSVTLKYLERGTYDYYLLPDGKTVMKTTPQRGHYDYITVWRSDGSIYTGSEHDYGKWREYLKERAIRMDNDRQYAPLAKGREEAFRAMRYLKEIPVKHIGRGISVDYYRLPDGESILQMPYGSYDYIKEYATLTSSGIYSSYESDYENATKRHKEIMAVDAAHQRAADAETVRDIFTTERSIITAKHLARGTYDYYLLPDGKTEIRVPYTSSSPYEYADIRLDDGRTSYGLQSDYRSEAESISKREAERKEQEQKEAAKREAKREPEKAAPTPAQGEAISEEQEREADEQQAKAQEDIKRYRRETALKNNDIALLTARISATDGKKQALQEYIDGLREYRRNGYNGDMPSCVSTDYEVRLRLDAIRELEREKTDTNRLNFRRQSKLKEDIEAEKKALKRDIDNAVEFALDKAKREVEQCDSLIKENETRITTLRNDRKALEYKVEFIVKHPEQAGKEIVNRIGGGKVLEIDREKDLCAVEEIRTSGEPTGRIYMFAPSGLKGIIKEGEYFLTEQRQNDRIDYVNGDKRTSIRTFNTLEDFAVALQERETKADERRARQEQKVHRQQPKERGLNNERGGRGGFGYGD